MQRSYMYYTISAWFNFYLVNAVCPLTFEPPRLQSMSLTAFDK